MTLSLISTKKTFPVLTKLSVLHLLNETAVVAAATAARLLLLRCTINCHRLRRSELRLVHCDAAAAAGRLCVITALLLRIIRRVVALVLVTSAVVSAPVTAAHWSEWPSTTITMQKTKEKHIKRVTLGMLH